jgi:hypothetical protein
MIIVGCDFHTRFQQVAIFDPTTGEIVERRLEHETGEARRFYASLCEPARVGIEATGGVDTAALGCLPYGNSLVKSTFAGIPCGIA